MTTTMIIEPVRAFNGMDVLVARDEGLFEAEGLDLQFASHRPGDLRSSANGTLETPITNQGILQERGEARMFQGWACGNNRRVAESEIGALQVGRRGMVVCGALVVPPDSSVYTPQDLAHKLVALDYGNGTSYAGLQMLEGAAHADRIERVHVDECLMVDTGSQTRFKLVAALKRRSTLDRAAFKTWWLDQHAPLVKQFPELARYQVNLVPEGEPEGFCDGIAEVYFNDLETLLRITASQQVKTVQQDSVVHSVAINRLWVEEHSII